MERILELTAVKQQHQQDDGERKMGTTERERVEKNREIRENM